MVSAGERAPAPRRAVDRTLLMLEGLAGLGVVVAIVGKTYGFAPTIFFLFASLAATFAGWAIVRAAGAWRDAALDVTGRIRDTERERLEHEKLILLRGIKELEVDAAIGKVDRRDYQHLRKTAEDRAIAIIERLEREDQHWAEQARLLVEQRLGAAARAPVEAAAPETEPAEGSRAAGEGATSPAVSFAPANGAIEPADASLFDDRPVALAADGALLVCAACTAKSDTDARYCTGCGRPREGAER